MKSKIINGKIYYRCGTPITSKNPIKKEIMKHFKRAIGCDRVTSVRELKSQNRYIAHCMKRDGTHYESMGDQWIDAKDLGKHIEDAPPGRGWYHQSEKGITHKISYFFSSDEIGGHLECNWWGPFETFGKCQQDAIEYHQCDIDEAKAGRDSAKDIRKGHQ